MNGKLEIKFNKNNFNIININYIGWKGCRKYRRDDIKWYKFVNYIRLLRKVLLIK